MIIQTSRSTHQFNDLPDLQPHFDTRIDILLQYIRSKVDMITTYDLTKPMNWLLAPRDLRRISDRIISILTATSLQIKQK